MASSFFFYDLETSGISPARDRIMQFAGQRTDLELKLQGEPVNINIKLSPDILPGAEAVLISGLSIKDNQASGISEAEFSRLFNSEIAQPGTIFIGFNNLRFDDEFIRYTNYRNFYDAFSWHWRNDASRWDLLDVLRMTRALRPEGINWPNTEEGKPTNRLELLTKANKLDHFKAHDALSDALATIEVARLLKESQPKLFKYLLGLRTKARVVEVLNANPALIYTSSHYSSDFLHTTVVAVLSLDTASSSALVYDLRVPAKDFMDLSITELSDLWRYDPEFTKPRLPVKTMRLNRCPAIAPLSVLDDQSISRLKLDMDEVQRNLKYTSERKVEFAAKLKKVAKKLDDERDSLVAKEPRIPSVDERLYDKFVASEDSKMFNQARSKAKLKTNFELSFSEKRLSSLYSLYRARNYPAALNKEEQLSWQSYVHDKLFEAGNSAFELYLASLNELKKQYNGDKLELLNELTEYANNLKANFG